MGQQPHTQGTTATGLSMHRGEGSDRVLELIGEIDVATSPMLRSELSDLLADVPERATLDFTQVSFIDSSGLGVLVGALKRLRETCPDAVLHVAHAQGAVRNVFDITGLDQLFELS